VTHLSYAQNGEDIRVWRAFRDLVPAEDFSGFTYVDVGANYPWEMSITASLYCMGWRGLLVEADPDLAAGLRIARPGDVVAEVAAGAQAGELGFYRVPGTGLGTLDPVEAAVARSRGFEVLEQNVQVAAMDSLLSRFTGESPREIHFMSIDVEGAESQVLAGLSLREFRPWVLCIEAVEPGTSKPSHSGWEPQVLAADYLPAGFDGINRWYVATEHSELQGSISIPFNVIDAGEFGWQTARVRQLDRRSNLSFNRIAWQNELLNSEVVGSVPTSEYEKQIHELRSALALVEGSRSLRYSRKVTRSGKAVLHRVRVARTHLPGFIQTPLVRSRHLKHVKVNLRHLTNPAYLGSPPADVVAWIRPEGLPEIPPAGLALTNFTTRDSDLISVWLKENLWDSDSQLDRRMDNHGDELGRARSALRTRMRLLDQIDSSNLEPDSEVGSRVLFDARSLQSPAFGNRGIGRFALAALKAVRESVPLDRLVLLTDPGLQELPIELTGGCQQVSRVSEEGVACFAVFVQPSPMTGSIDPYLSVMKSSIHKIAIIFDFIPLHYPTIYLASAAARAEYAASLDTLKFYNEYACISHLAKRELEEFLGHSVSACVAWPREITAMVDTVGSDASRYSTGDSTGAIVVMTGDEPRKNTFGALAAIGAATAGEPERNVVVLGMAGQETRVHHWSIAAAMRPGEARTLGRVSDSEMGEVLSSASLVVVNSFDEGLSLPVIEALAAGTPVVASNISSHRELIGSGGYLVDPADLKTASRAIRRYRGDRSAATKQLRKLQSHSHLALEDVIAQVVDQHVPVKSASTSAGVTGGVAGSSGSGRLRIGVATPWGSQPTGVADFSVATISALANLADVTVFTTSGGMTHSPLAEQSGIDIDVKNIDELLGNAGEHSFDVMVVVAGNSHFHLPFVELTTLTDCVVIAHDTRMVEFYMSLRDRGGVEQVMLKTLDPNAPAAISPPLDDQIDDMRLLQNAGMWEVARRSQGLVLHAESAAQRLAVETGMTPVLLPFANQRIPASGVITVDMRSEARARLGFDASCIHLASFGYVDTRTKMSDQVIQAAGWLSQWGHKVSLRLVGSASVSVIETLNLAARSAGIHEFCVTGFVSEEEFRDYLLAVDLGVQLRISPQLGVSGPLSDLAAFGTRAVASSGLAVDVDAPEYIHRLPESVSALLVAEAIESVLESDFDPSSIESERIAYLAGKRPDLYAQKFLDYLETIVGVK
jgi:FkbM family methyltransferase